MNMSVDTNEIIYQGCGLMSKGMYHLNYTSVCKQTEISCVFECGYLVKYYIRVLIIKECTILDHT